MNEFAAVEGDKTLFFVQFLIFLRGSQEQFEEGLKKNGILDSSSTKIEEQEKVLRSGKNPWYFLATGPLGYFPASTGR